MAMKRNCSKLISLCLVLCMMLSLAVCASAAEIDTSGGSGTTPVSLTTTNGGIGGGDDGDITPTKLNVTVPTTLPLAMSDEGTVVTATDCKITNFSYLEVPDEIAGQLDRFKLDEEAHRVRVLRAKAYFSLDRGDGIEKDALQKPPQPLELILKAEQAERLNAALRSLSERQRRRLLAFYLDGKSKSQIAREEGVSENSVRESIQGGLMRLKKSLKNF